MVPHHIRSQRNSKSSKARRRLFFEHLEDRSLLAVTVTVSDGIVNEPAFGPPSDMQFTVQLSEPRDVVTIFNWFTNPYTATPGDDYDQNGGSLTFQPGETEHTISVPIFSDVPHEPNEQFYLELANPFAGPLARFTDINPDGGDASPQGFTEFNGDIYFSATDPVHGRELWKYDGTDVSLVADINLSGSSNPGYLTVWNGGLYFTAFTPAASGEIWRYDGSTVTQVTNFIKPQFIESQPADLTVYKNELYFSTNGDFNGSKDLFKLRTNGTTQKVVDLNPNGSDNPAWLTVYKDLLVFRGSDGANGNEMWTFDGFSTRRYEATPGSFSSDAGLFTEMGGILYFVATGYDTAGNWVGRELYQFDGTRISVAADIRPFEANSSPESFVTYNDALYFRARGRVDAQGNGITEFWKYDGRQASLVMSETTDKAGPGTYAVFNNELYMSVNHSFYGPGIFRFDGVHLIPVVEFSTGDPLATYAFKTIGEQLFFRADDNFFGVEGWTLTAEVVIADGHAVGTIVDTQNDPPVAFDDTFDLVEDNGLSAAASAFDPNGSPVTFQLITGPKDGLLEFETDGNFTFQPPTDFNGPVSFTFQASDGSLLSNIATVSINVTPVNDAPRTYGDQATVFEDVRVTRQLTATDADGDAVTFQLVTGPQHGSVDLSSTGEYTYTPSPNYHGSDTFKFGVTDGQLPSNVAQVYVTIHGVNDPPVGGDDAYSVPEDGTLSVNAPGVLGNDTDIDGDALTVALVVAPDHGALTLSSNGSFTYQPAANYHGPDQFTYAATDGAATTGQITVSLTITPVNDAPAANPGSKTTAEDTAVSGQVTGSDVDGDALTFQLVDSPQHGSVVLNSDGNYTYTPAADFSGSDSFTFRASDGVATSSKATISLAVTPVNDAPTAANDSVTGDEDINLTFDVRGNDVDVDGDTLTPQVVAGPVNGTLTPNPNGTFTYDPKSDFFGTDTFTYRVSDGTVVSNLATVTITVRSQGETPAISVTPSDPANTIVLRDPQVPVAILSSDSFNAVAQVDVATLTFGKTGNEKTLITHKKNGPKYEVRDVNGDGLLDLLVYFSPANSGLAPGDTQATLKGRLNDGSVFSANHAVTVVRR